MFTRLLARMASALLVPFRFINCIPNTLDICLSWLISRVRPGQSRGVRSWGSFGVFCSRELLSFHHPNSSEVSALFASIFVVFWSSGGFLSVYCLSLCSLFIADILWSSCMDWFATTKDIPGILVPAFCYHHLVTKKVS